MTDIRPYLAIGAGLAAVAWVFGARCDVGLFLFHDGLLEPGDLAAFRAAGGKYLVLKMLDGTRPFEPHDTARMMAEARSLGLVVEGWGYHYSRTIAEASAEGSAAASICRQLGVPRYYWDAEDEWAHSAAVPADTARAFLRAFRAGGPGAGAWWSSYSGATHDKEAAADDPSTQAPYDILAEWDGYAPQCYGTTTQPGRSDERLFRLHVDRIAKGRLAGIPLAPIFTTGDVDPLGQHWTPWQGAWGIESVVAHERLTRINIWYGGNSRGRMQRRGKYAPPLVAMIPAIRRWQVQDG